MQVWGKKAIFALMALGALNSSGAVADPSAQPASPCGRGWVFLDLGKTLIDTSNWQHLHYLPQAREYIHELSQAGYHVGLISNVPDTWGPTVEAKLVTMKEEIRKNWDNAVAFEWEPYERVLLPPTDQQRKPAPFLFEEARGLEAGCRIAYLSGDLAEVQAAKDAGFESGIVVGKNFSATPYPPADQIFP